MADVLAEIAALAEQGVREVNLLGQNVNAYRGEMPDGSICDFAELLPYVADPLRASTESATPPRTQWSFPTA